MKMTKILFATDFSDVNKQALDFAASLARDTGATLQIVHVSNRERSPAGELVDEEPELDPEEMHELKSVVPTDPQVKFEHRLVQVEPARAETVKPDEEIVKLAKQEQIDAIVLGTHGRSGLRHLLMGSVAESVVRNAPCPVITVKQPDDAASKSPGG